MMFRSVFLIAVGIASTLCAAPPTSTSSSFPLLRPKNTVVFIGDSITDGGRARTGQDYNHTMGQGYAFILAATLGDQLDGVHPHYAGHALMAPKWMKTVSAMR
ncbi:MAG: hypothetical protein JF599_14030 [Verrucomicrobia bacterium]|nr:hypothetical protein [Verrucomicrobiota bacterium]